MRTFVIPVLMADSIGPSFLFASQCTRPAYRPLLTDAILTKVHRIGSAVSEIIFRACAFLPGTHRDNGRSFDALGPGANHGSVLSVPGYSRGPGLHCRLAP